MYQESSDHLGCPPQDDNPFSRLRQPLNPVESTLFRLDHPPTFTFSLEITGPCDEQKINQALALLTRKYYELNACVKENVEEETPVPYLEGLPEFACFKANVLFEYDKKSAKHYLEAVTHDKFDLLKPPLISVYVCPHEDASWTIGFRVCHLVSDGMGAWILIKDFLVVYNEILQDKTPTISPLPVLYPDVKHYEASIFQKSLSGTGQSAKATGAKMKAMSMRFPASVTGNLLKMVRSKRLGVYAYITAVLSHEFYKFCLSRGYSGENSVINVRTARNIRCEEDGSHLQMRNWVDPIVYEVETDTCLLAETAKSIQVSLSNSASANKQTNGLPYLISSGFGDLSRMGVSSTWETFVVKDVNMFANMSSLSKHYFTYVFIYTFDSTLILDGLYSEESFSDEDYARFFSSVKRSIETVC